MWTTVLYLQSFYTILRWTCPSSYCDTYHGLPRRHILCCTHVILIWSSLLVGPCFDYYLSFFSLQWWLLFFICLLSPEKCGNFLAHFAHRIEYLHPIFFVFWICYLTMHAIFFFFWCFWSKPKKNARAMCRTTPN